MCRGTEYGVNARTVETRLGGIAANGWRWWSIATDEASEPPATKTAPKTRKATGGTKRARRGTVGADSVQTDEQAPSETDVTETREEAQAE